MLWKNLTQPSSACFLINANYTGIHSEQQLEEMLQSSSPHTYASCTNFEFSTEDGTAKTLVQEFGLVCERANLLSVVEMCFLLGVAVGSVASGWISDSFGRKHTLMGCALMQVVFGKPQTLVVQEEKIQIVFI